MTRNCQFASNDRSTILSRRRFAVGFSGGLFVSLLSGCAAQPAKLPNPLIAQLNGFNAIFAEFWADRIRQYPPITQGPAFDRLSIVNRRIGAIIGLSPTSTTRFVLFDSPDVQAFALSFGRVGIDRGLLETCDNNGQIAAHLCQRIACDVLAKDDPDGLGLIAQALLIGLQKVPLSPVAAKFEMMADLASTEMLAECGYDPREMLAIRGRSLNGTDNEYLPQASRLEVLSTQLHTMGYQV